MDLNKATNAISQNILYCSDESVQLLFYAWVVSRDV